MGDVLDWLHKRGLMADPAFARVRLSRFGPFELDARAGELRKHGIKIKLREQPVQILEMLLERPGEVVLREEIRLRLWPNNTIVEFDHGINAAIQKLRDALGDSAAEPRYVETVARRGYRFVAQVASPVTQVDSPPAKFSWLWPSVAGVLALAVAALAIIHFRQSPPEAALIRTYIPPPDGATFNFTGEPQTVSPAAFSPDGRRMVFGAIGPDRKNQL